jgi:hypothetical protein
MAALTITAANVRVVSQTTCPTVQAGEAITQGQAVFRASNGKYYLTDADDTAEDQVSGIAMTPADADGDYFAICSTVGARIDIGATTAKGTTYHAGANTTPGSLSPAVDLGSGDAVLPTLVAEDTAGICSLILHNPSTPIIL